MENVKYKLIHPIQFGSETITELDFKPLRAKHLKRLTGKSETADTIALGQLSSGLTVEQYDEIMIEDLQAIKKIIAGFLGVSQETGVNG